MQLVSVNWSNETGMVGIKPDLLNHVWCLEPIALCVLYVGICWLDCLRIQKPGSKYEM